MRAAEQVAFLVIVSGGNVKVVQQMLGHACAAMILDQYGHLFGDRLDDIADRLDEAAESYLDPAASRANNVRPLSR